MEAFRELRKQLIEVGGSLAARGLLRDIAYKIDEGMQILSYQQNGEFFEPSYHPRKLIDVEGSCVEVPFNEYEFEYIKILKKRKFSFLLNDGSIIQLGYVFKRGKLCKSRCAYFESPFDYECLFSEYSDYVQCERTPLSFRIEFDPEASDSILHPATHFTIMNAEGCRIPVTTPPDISSFVSFLLHHFLNFPSKNHVGTAGKVSFETIFHEELKSCFVLSVPYA